MPEGMPLNPEPYDEPPDFSSERTSQITQITVNISTPPPLHFNLNLPLYQPTLTGISDRGAPPSYEEAINPNGISFYFQTFIKKFFK